MGIWTFPRRWDRPSMDTHRERAWGKRQEPALSASFVIRILREAGRVHKRCCRKKQNDRVQLVSQTRVIPAILHLKIGAILHLGVANETSWLFDIAIVVHISLDIAPCVHQCEGRARLALKKSGVHRIFEAPASHPTGDSEYLIGQESFTNQIWITIG